MKRAFLIIVVLALWALAVWCYLAVPDQMAQAKESGQPVSGIQKITFQVSSLTRDHTIPVAIGLGVLTVVALVFGRAPQSKE